MTTSVTIGPAFTFVQNTVYALPARQVRVMSTIALEVSVDNSAWTAVAASTTGTDITGVFTRCTTGAAIAVFKV